MLLPGWGLFGRLLPEGKPVDELDTVIQQMVVSRKAVVAKPDEGGWGIAIFALVWWSTIGYVAFHLITKYW